MNIHEQANKIVYDFSKKELTESCKKLAEFGGKETDTNTLIENVLNANSWINFISGDDDVAYEQNRFHLVVDQDMTCTIFQGIEIHTDFRTTDSPDREDL